LIQVVAFWAKQLTSWLKIDEHSILEPGLVLPYSQSYLTDWSRRRLTTFLRYLMNLRSNLSGSTEYEPVIPVKPFSIQ
jgi:hypothetical protein